MTAPAPVQIIQAHLDAFNAHDLPGLLALVSRDVVVRSNDIVDTGNDYARYADTLEIMFSRNPEVKAELLDRMALANVVIDEIILSGLTAGTEHTITMYEITAGLIASIRVITE